MGLFGSKKTYVASTIYNMAGDINDRPSFLKTLIAGQTIVGTADSYAEAIKDGYLNGPGIRIRSFGRWATQPGNYPLVGLIRGDYRGKFQVEPTLIEALIETELDEEINFQRTEVDTADYSFWAEQWMLQYHPDLFNTPWIADFDEVTNTITVTFVDTTTESFVVTGFDPGKVYLYALYNIIKGEETGDTTEGEIIEEDWPALGDWDFVGSSTVNVPVNLDTTTHTESVYSDDHPDEESTSTSSRIEYYDNDFFLYRQNEYKGKVGAVSDRTYSIERDLNLFTNYRIVENVETTVENEEFDDGMGGTYTKTTTTTVTTENLEVYETYRIDEREVTNLSFLPTKMLIYEIGSGGSEAIDAKLTEADDDGYFMPFIPVRLQNEMISGVDYNLAYDQAKKAYYKLTGSRKYDKEVMDPIADHEKVDDMDYVYVMVGTSLNTKENAAKLYIFELFDRIRLAQTVGETAYTTWFNNQTQFETDNSAWTAWILAQEDPENPLFGTEMPTIGQSYTAPSNEIRIKADGTLPNNVDMRISWQAMSRSTGSGLLKPNSKPGDCYIEFVNRNQLYSIGYNDGEPVTLDPVSVDRVVISKQTSTSTWALITVTGLVHRNYIYKGKAVEITAKDALEDSEESGFLVPLHMDVFESMSMIDKTQMSMACVYMVVNTYVVKKTGFFGSVFFKIILFVAIIAITIATGGIGASTVGVLGANAAVAAAIGLSGFIGVLVGAIANALAAMIIARIIALGAGELFGDKIGAIIGSVLAIAAIAVGTSLQSGQTLSTAMSNLARADNIINLTSAVGNGISGYVQAGAMETMEETKRLQEEFKEKSSEISKLFEENFGYFKTLLDPLEIYQAKQEEEMFVIEDSLTFLTRTLMTGSEVAELSHSLVSDFADFTLSTALKG